MEIKKLYFKNIGSYGNKLTEFDFTKFKNGELVGFIGKNGQGKTFFLDALFYSLFGSPFRKVNVPEIINRENNKEMYTEIHFMNNDKNYIFKRGLRPNIFEIYENGTRIQEEAHAKVLQRHAERNILGANEQIFRLMYMIGQGNFKSFFSYATNQRRVLWEEILRITVLTVMLNKVKNEYKSLENNLTLSEEQIRLYESKVKSFEKHLQKIRTLDITKRSKLEEDIDLIQAEIEHISSSDLNKQYVDSIKHKLAVSKQKYENICDEVDDVERNVKQLKKHRTFYDKSSTCPTCEQSISEQFAEIKIKELDAQIHILNEQLQQKISIAQTQLLPVIDEHEILLKSIKEKELHLKELKIKANVLINQLSDIDSTDTSDNIVETIMNDIRNSIQEKQDKEVEIKEIKQQLIENEHLKQILSDCGFKNFLYESFIPLLNDYVNENIQGFNFPVVFELKPTLEDIFHLQNGECVGYDNFSNGEKQIIEISFIFGFQRFLEQFYNFTCNITFMDEMFDSVLDAERIGNIIEFFNTRINKTLFVISHNNTMKENFNKTFFVKKEHGFSVLIEEN